MVIIAGGLLLGLLLAIASFSRFVPSPSAPVVENSVTQLAQNLKSATQVPLALPSQVPAAQTYYSSIAEVQSDRYWVNLDVDRDCLGVANCNLGAVSGEVASLQTIDEQYGNLEGFSPPLKSTNLDQTVTLAQGIQGRFIPYVCGASCSTSKLVWGQDGYRYLVSLQARVVPDDQEVQALITMANSAIANRQP
ncbi:hypothetical protein [Lyngbya confervoides]|uniref:Serine/threonine protein kinase n=1 Tax=Lyngbya confervoides BDU141951 TaxID=1574623 RepID=A0ABD4T9D4_9CYAN|nr:hypothetical protein [Lyngbya confervoides]MCM1985093.1 hypothetical protein [Lyngbya confervoides BDU141951]